MADYQLTDSPRMIRRTIDGAWIPNDPANSDWLAFQAWIGMGNVPDPFIPPPPPMPVLTKGQFWAQAAVGGFISDNDAIDAMGGDLPHDINQYIQTLPASVRFMAKMAFLGETFERLKPGATRFKEAFSLTDAQMDTFFFNAAAL